MNTTLLNGREKNKESERKIGVLWGNCLLRRGNRCNVPSRHIHLIYMHPTFVPDMCSAVWQRKKGKKIPPPQRHTRDKLNYFLEEDKKYGPLQPVTIDLWHRRRRSKKEVQSQSKGLNNHKCFILFYFCKDRWYSAPSLRGGMAQ